jgi:hypothetical protein
MIGPDDWRDGWTPRLSWELAFFEHLIRLDGQEERASHLAGVTLRNVEVHRARDVEFRRRWAMVRELIREHVRQRYQRAEKRRRYCEAVRRLGV